MKGILVDPDYPDGVHQADLSLEKLIQMIKYGYRTNKLTSVQVVFIDGTWITVVPS